MFFNCYVINNKTGKSWLIDTDTSKPVFLKNGLPFYKPDQVFNYHLSNRPSDDFDSGFTQLNIFDFLVEKN